MKVLPVYRCVTVSVNVTVMLASVLLIVHSLEPEAVTIATQPRSTRRVSNSRSHLAAKAQLANNYYSLYTIYKKITDVEVTIENNYFPEVGNIPRGFRY